MKEFKERLSDIQLYQSFSSYLIGNEEIILSEEEFGNKLREIVFIIQLLLSNYDNNSFIKNIISKEDLLKLGLTLDDLCIEYKS